MVTTTNSTIATCVPDTIWALCLPVTEQPTPLSPAPQLASTHPTPHSLATHRRHGTHLSIAHPTPLSPPRSIPGAEVVSETISTLQRERARVTLQGISDNFDRYCRDNGVKANSVAPGRTNRLVGAMIALLVTAVAGGYAPTDPYPGLAYSVRVPNGAWRHGEWPKAMGGKRWHTTLLPINECSYLVGMQCRRLVVPDLRESGASAHPRATCCACAMHVLCMCSACAQAVLYCVCTMHCCETPLPPQLIASFPGCCPVAQPPLSSRSLHLSQWRRGSDSWRTAGAELCRRTGTCRPCEWRRRWW